MNLSNFQRDHFRVKPIMIFYAVYTILSLFALVTLSLRTVIIGVIHTAILAYIYVVIYSVYDLLRREYETAFGRQNQEARKALNEIWTKKLIPKILLLSNSKQSVIVCEYHRNNKQLSYQPLFFVKLNLPFMTNNNQQNALQDWRFSWILFSLQRYRFPLVFSNRLYSTTNNSNYLLRNWIKNDVGRNLHVSHDITHY